MKVVALGNGDKGKVCYPSHSMRDLTINRAHHRPAKPIHVSGISPKYGNPRSYVSPVPAHSIPLPQGGVVNGGEKHKDAVGWFPQQKGGRSARYGLTFRVVVTLECGVLLRNA